MTSVVVESASVTCVVQPKMFIFTRTTDTKPAAKKKEEKRSRSHDGRSKGRGRGFKSQTVSNYKVYQEINYFK